MRKRDEKLQASDFFVIRAPLLPSRYFTRAIGETTDPWHAHEDARPNRASAREQLLVALRSTVSEPSVREALSVASNDLVEGLNQMHWDRDDEKSRRVVRSLTKYLIRMSTRSTPFGLFAATGIGFFGSVIDMTALSKPRRRIARLDMSYLDALSVRLIQDPERRRTCRYRKNATIFRSGARAHYIALARGDGTRQYSTASFDFTPELGQLLSRAEDGARWSELVDVLLEAGVQLDDADAFLTEVIEAGILVTEFEPSVTDSDPVGELASQLADCDTTRALKEIGSHLRRINAVPLGAAGPGYDALNESLRGLPSPENIASSLHVDTALAPGAKLDETTVKEIAQVAEALLCMPAHPTNTLQGFVRAFEERYDRRAVPLLEALDPDLGIGLPDDPKDEAFINRQSELTKLLQPRVEALSEKRLSSLMLTDADVEMIRSRYPVACPPGIAVAFSVARVTANREFDYVVSHAIGPSSVTWFGRFCHADERLAAAVQAQLAREAASDRSRIHAEIVHLPGGPAANVVNRPAVQAAEIPILSRTTSPQTTQIGVDDLLVSVHDGKVVLTSIALNREVHPTLTSAHNPHSGGGLILYRFLAAIRNQGYSQLMAWQWGALQEREWLPRVIYGRSVIARAQWRLNALWLRELISLDDSVRARRIETLRHDLRLPRFVQFAEGDNVLQFDLSNPLHIDVLLSQAKKVEKVVLQEVLPLPGDYASGAHDAVFAHECLLPFVRTQHSVERAEREEVRADVRYFGVTNRRHAPGSEWLYAKLYGSSALADGVLANAIRPLADMLLSEGVAERFFFIRYADPRPHLRVRFFGKPERLASTALPQLLNVCRPLLDECRLHDVQLATYEQEIERYEGPLGMQLSERIFHVDSLACLKLITNPGGIHSLQTRRLLLLRGIEDMLRLFMNASDVLSFLGLASQHASVSAKRAYSDAFRAERHSIESTLECYGGSVLDTEDAAILRWRVEALRPIGAEVRTRILESLSRERQRRYLLSLTHMFANRLMKDDQPREELNSYGLLERAYSSLRARRMVAASR